MGYTRIRNNNAINNKFDVPGNGMQRFDAIRNYNIIECCKLLTKGISLPLSNALRYVSHKIKSIIIPI